MTPVFYIERTQLGRLYLRRYSSSPCPNMPGQYSYHDRMVYLKDGPVQTVCADSHPHDDPLWPTHCTCGHEFQETDTWQLFNHPIYKRVDTGEEMILKDAPVGACWNAFWMAERRKERPCFDVGDDGLSLVVRTPGGDWPIDSRANNCTMPNDTAHKCWVRHSSPEDPNGTFTVDKNGVTCGAGAGSIVIGNWHGWVRNSHLISC